MPSQRLTNALLIEPQGLEFGNALLGALGLPSAMQVRVGMQVRGGDANRSGVLLSRTP